MPPKADASQQGARLDEFPLPEEALAAGNDVSIVRDDTTINVVQANVLTFEADAI